MDVAESATLHRMGSSNASDPARRLLLPKRTRDLVHQRFDQIRKHPPITSRDEDFHRHAGHKRPIAKERDVLVRHGHPNRIVARPVRSSVVISADICLRVPLICGVVL